MPQMTGHKFIAETLHGYGVTCVFHVPYILDGALVEMERLGIRRVLCHSEKSAAYMADGYARATRKPGIAMAQSVGAANLAAGLQDAYLARSPVFAITGRWPPVYQYRHAYQEINHWPLYEPVTKFNALVDRVQELPILLRQAFREATSGSPGPVHLDVLGYTGELVAESEADLEVVIEDSFKSCPAFRPEPEPERVEAAARRLEQWLNYIVRARPFCAARVLWVGRSQRRWARSVPHRSVRLSALPATVVSGTISARWKPLSARALTA